MELGRSHWTKEKPLPVLRDSRGIEIKPGLRVAYNHSGNVKFGSIISLERSEWKPCRKEENDERSFYGLDFKLLIKNEETGIISTIKNPNSFLIL